MMQNKVVMLDIDGVLANWLLAFSQLANTLYGTPVIQDGDQTDWELNGLIPQDVQSKTWTHIKRDGSFWINLLPLVSQDTFYSINDLPDVYFVTGRPSGNRAKELTEAWLQHYGLKLPTVIFSKRKGEIALAIEATHSIDDKAGNAVAISYTSSKTKSYLLNKAYNQFDHSVIGSKVKRIYSVDEFLQEVNS